MDVRAYYNKLIEISCRETDTRCAASAWVLFFRHCASHAELTDFFFGRGVKNVVCFSQSIMLRGFSGGHMIDAPNYGRSGQVIFTVSFFLMVAMVTGHKMGTVPRGSGEVLWVREDGTVGLAR